MKRIHLHVGVADISTSVGFYSALFAAEPTVLKPELAADAPCCGVAA